MPTSPSSTSPHIDHHRLRNHPITIQKIKKLQFDTSKLQDFPNKQKRRTYQVNYFKVGLLISSFSFLCKCLYSKRISTWFTKTNHIFVAKSTIAKSFRPTKTKTWCNRITKHSSAFANVRFNHPANLVLQKISSFVWKSQLFTFFRWESWFHSNWVFSYLPSVCSKNINTYSTLAKPSAVPVCVPKKIETFFFPSSKSSVSTTAFSTCSFGNSSCFFFADPEARR